ncbi:MULTISPECIES: hypothetical protein [unclassified Candidatus Frackibacter]|uniref:hypothetical protein n=1 Tax=unclassified Candidatus Frackibacter TaxID=2648818 RepID=UPI00088584A5|nr:MULTISPECIES: hypothetical protein [unclassified Candidatus Frackibacter]SDC82185.1 hypothetical protein SAMN04515661_12727 [Candidatus Frackibacter sp. WG11]SEM96063.1 hypothetical protein SAMN04488698_1294 [Candidatus Frackibacter sp. WG12]SFM04307.1 hypothetical protein SAMN04488699_12826 [Candidatus Frackibacter sp. WG13]
MDFIRKIINSNEIDKIIKLPQNLKNQRVEVLILPINDDEKKKENFNPEDFTNILDIKDVETELKIMRDEWERI